LEDALSDNTVLLSITFIHSNDMFGWNECSSETDSVAINENAPIRQQKAYTMWMHNPICQLTSKATLI